MCVVVQTNRGAALHILSDRTCNLLRVHRPPSSGGVLGVYVPHTCSDGSSPHGSTDEGGATYRLIGGSGSDTLVGGGNDDILQTGDDDTECMAG